MSLQSSSCSRLSSDTPSKNCEKFEYDFSIANTTECLLIYICIIIRNVNKFVKFLLSNDISSSVLKVNFLVTFRNNIFASTTCL